MVPPAGGLQYSSHQQILDDSFEIGVFNVCLAPGTTHSAEVVEDQIDIPVDAGTIDGEVRISQLHATESDSKDGS
jgi:hypothetical protein